MAARRIPLLLSRSFTSSSPTLFSRGSYTVSFFIADAIWVFFFFSVLCESFIIDQSVCALSGYWENDNLKRVLNLTFDDDDDDDDMILLAFLMDSIYKIKS